MQPLAARRKNLISIRGYGNRMLKLRAEGFIARRYRPAIMLVQNRRGLASIDHRLDSKEHPLFQRHAGAGFAEM